MYAGSPDNKFVNALDASTGKEKLRYKTGPRVFSSPIVADGRLFAGVWEGMPLSLDLEKGQPGAGFFTGTGVLSSPVLSG